MFDSQRGEKKTLQRDTAFSQGMLARRAESRGNQEKILALDEEARMLAQRHGRHSKAVKIVVDQLNALHDREARIFRQIERVEGRLKKK